MPTSASSTARRRIRLLIRAVSATALVASGVAIADAPAHAANEPVNVWLTTTNDSGGRNVTQGLAQQAPVSFSAGSGSSGQVVTVDENTKYQQFTGAGASFTDTAAWLINSSGALSASTRNTLMNNLFSPTTGIGLDFLRNPMGASDLARYNYTYDDMPSGQTDPSLANFSIAHDLVDVLPLTKQAQQLNPGLKVMGTPWTAPPWMKDSGAYSQGWLQSQYYAAYAQYFVKYIQAYQAQGVPIDFVSVQNEPTCCSGYPSMQWNGSGLDYFTVNDLLPAFHAASLSTKVLALDWNPDSYASYGAPTVDDATVRNDPNFGGIAWHGYEGDVSTQTDIHNQYPDVDSYDTEHSGGTWIANQQQEDMNNIIDYTRNWGKSVVKWSLAVDQNMGPHNGGCGTCTGLVTVHNGDSQSGQVDYNIEYYDMGQLTKFVKPGAYRIDSTADTSVPNVAWINPDGSKALVAYNESGSTQTLTVNWGNETFSYSLPAQTSATFVWNGTQSNGGGGGAPTGQFTGYGGKCVDNAGGSSANGTAVQLYDCNGSSAQQWTVAAGGTLQALGKCMDVTGAGTTNGTQVQLYDCNGTAAQQWQHQSNGELVNANSGRCLDATGPSSANGTRLQIWDCTDAANQQWTLPS
ncbi:ricin-type beta-trefoil lectin domain protein [Catenulispora sp. NF23]|uniref:ricin-type beta-trefoil lectin domain protein n=1 Tax=Catenulispora pinistramenti TaxID=2705254 RepID=UPI001BA7D8D6|nr:ricin-type beta-trefoil lectin domain protein [Catenulispora pinistramenti]MBS2539615.1 ricin-type beta-trefoil lectin domain protein [Catenulispora pinistramenti]